MESHRGARVFFTVLQEDFKGFSGSSINVKCQRIFMNFQGCHEILIGSQRFEGIQRSFLKLQKI